MARVSRSDVLARIRNRVGRGEPVILAGTGVGLVARAAAAAGIDILMAYNIARFRMDGHPSLIGYLPYGDANGITEELAAQLLPVAGDVPVIAGVGAADPYRELSSLLDRMIDLGYSGVTNTPTAGAYDGEFRRSIDAQGIGYSRELDMVHMCRVKEIFSLGYAFNPDEARSMAEAGADVVAAHLGTTASASDLDRALADAVARTTAMSDAAVAGRADVLVVAHGGPLENPANLSRVLERTPVIGYIAGSSLERIPVDAAVRQTAAAFRGLRLGVRDGSLHR